MACSQDLQSPAQADKGTAAPEHTRTQEHKPPSPTPHYPLLGVFRLATPWRCQMSP